VKFVGRLPPSKKNQWAEKRPIEEVIERARLAFKKGGQLTVRVSVDLGPVLGYRCCDQNRSKLTPGPK